MNQYEIANAKEKVSGYYFPRPEETSIEKRTAAFERARAECVFNLKKQIEQIQALTPQQFGIAEK